jgi:hypothetical protein
MPEIKCFGKRIPKYGAQSFSEVAEECHPTKPPAFEFLSERTEKKAFVTVACGGRDQRQTAFGPAVVTDVAGTFCNPCVRARQTSNWCRRGESNRRAMLKSRKLLILRIARNAKTAKNVFHGYAAATRNAVRDFHAGRSRGYAKLSYQIRRSTNRPTGRRFFIRIRLSGLRWQSILIESRVSRPWRL